MPPEFKPQEKHVGHAHTSHVHASTATASSKHAYERKENDKQYLKDTSNAPKGVAAGQTVRKSPLKAFRTEARTYEDIHSARADKMVSVVVVLSFLVVMFVLRCGALLLKSFMY